MTVSSYVIYNLFIRQFDPRFEDLNLAISLWTVIVEMIILMSQNRLNDIERRKTATILQKEKASEKEMQEIHKKIDILLERSPKQPSLKK